MSVRKFVTPEGGRVILVDGGEPQAGWIEVAEFVETPNEQRSTAQTNRAAAYTAEADPIFFQYQRGEATEQEWLDKIEEIRARYPYPEE